MSKHFKNHCINCGAPVTTEICPYCHAITGVDSNYADMEYPVIECKEANVNFWNVIFPLIFAFAFGSVGIFFPLMGYAAGADFTGIGLFGLIGITAFIVAAVPVVRYIFISLYGREIEATVYGYLDDKVLFNGKPGQVVKLLVQTNDGLRFILYQLADTNQPFKVNSKIKLKVYKDMFHIVKENNYYFE